ncbi:hypothetical protein TRFO_29598 [Tritrichomonas foetus]|uniref:Uncharacterized protein n=1 Tax=Tritrichomonas foetus TaxID=1144522 RepID=A0A1J4JV94_9EUKA|nr:hypothetical protein TRFO_29598 [Tritrichomonas foetus]|eukprot:OHT03079.1 hypothetical protein TRFO_29598 [Tritrichomonas foetus]
MNDSIASTIPMMETFFRIHFSRNDEILEDLLPKLAKFDPNSPLSNSLKTILEDSGPCICLLNRLIKETRNHYQPSDINIKSRTAELEELYDILVSARKLLETELEFHSIVNAIISFHKRETNYPQVFNFLLTVVQNSKLNHSVNLSSNQRPNLMSNSMTNSMSNSLSNTSSNPSNLSSYLVKNLLKLLNDKALHSYCPYVADNDSDGDFSFDEISDVDPDLQPRMRVKETISEIIQKCNEKSSFAMNLFLNGIIKREDLLITSPELEHSSLVPDPVAIDSHNYVTQSVKRGENKANYDIFPRVQHSYRNSKQFIPVSSFTGASASEEFALSRNLIAVYTPLHEIEKYPPAINVDSDVSTTSIYSACQILHDQEIESDLLYKATTEILTKRIHPGLTATLSDIYGYESDDVIDFLKSAYEEAKPIVAKTMTDALTKLSLNYYKTMNDCYSRLTKESFRTFPHPEHIPECIEYFSSQVSVLAPEQSFVVEFIKSLFKNSVNDNEVFEMSFWETNLFTHFCLFYKFYIRRFKGYDYLRPLLPLVDSSVNWFMAYDSMIEDGLRDLGILEFDNEEFKYQTSFILTGMNHTIKTICDLFKEPNYVNGNLNPELINKNIKKVQFLRTSEFDVPVLKLNIL